MTIAALAVGCGAKLDEPPAATSDAGSDSDTAVQLGCPEAEPLTGSACNTTSSCFFGTCTAPDYRSTQRYECKDGKWTSQFTSSCNPPPPDCPPTPPRVGTPCPLSWGGCNYTDRCPENPTDSTNVYYHCSGGTWSRSGSEYTVDCPVVAPNHGDACLCADHMKTTRCQYNLCGTVYAKEAICDAATGTWSVLETSCNPPPPDLDAGAGSGP